MSDTIKDAEIHARVCYDRELRTSSQSALRRNRTTAAIRELFLCGEAFCFASRGFHRLLKFAGANIAGMGGQHALAGSTAYPAQFVTIVLRDVTFYVFVPFREQDFLARNKECFQPRP